VNATDEELGRGVQAGWNNKGRRLLAQFYPAKCLINLTPDARLGGFGGSVRRKLQVWVPRVGRVSAASSRAALRRLTLSSSWRAASAVTA
jgi:hypothetical protein